MGGGALLDRICVIFQRMCVIACDPRVNLSVSSIGFVYVFLLRMFVFMSVVVTVWGSVGMFVV